MSSNASESMTATQPRRRLLMARVRLRGRRRSVRAGVLLALGLIVATAIGAGLRLYQLQAHSLWADELYTLRAIVADGYASPVWRGWSHWASTLSLRLGGAELAAAEPYEPWHWRGLGMTPWNARLGPAIVGIASIPILALLALPMLGRRGAVMLALLMAVAPWHIEWSQNARFYIALFLASGAFIALYYHGSRTGSRKHVVAAAICLLIAFMHHAPAIFLLGVLAADWLVTRLAGRRLRLGGFGYGVMGAAAGLCAVLMALDLAVLNPSWEHLAEQPRSHGPAMLVAGTLYMGHVALMTLAAVTAWLLMRNRRRLGWYLALTALVPLATLLYLTATDQMFVHTRYGFYAYFAWLALAATGLAACYRQLRPRFGTLFACAPAAVVLVALLQISLFYHSGGAGFRSMWGQAFAWLDERAAADEPVLTSFTLAGFYYLQAGPPRVVSFPASAHELDEHAAEALAAAGGGRGVWLVTAATAAQGRQAEAWIDELAELKAYFDTRIEQPHSSVRVYWYEPGGDAGTEPPRAQGEDGV